jgi:hypothetical protein
MKGRTMSDHPNAVALRKGYEAFAQLVVLTAGTFGQEIHDLLASDEHAVADAALTP